MRKYRIVHDIDGRLRIRYGQDIFSKNQAINIKNDLAKWSMVEHVEVNDVTGSILFVYDALQKNELLKKLENRTITQDEYKRLQWDRRFVTCSNFSCFNILPLISLY